MTDRSAKMRRICAVGFTALGLGGCTDAHVKAGPGKVCHAEVRDDVLPAWARGGFSDPRPRPAHVLGASGAITGILFANPLSSPPAKDHRNKILWVSRVAADRGSDLHITAQRMMGSRRVGASVVRAVIGGPGPSIINLPSPGCWRLTLGWSGHVDSVDLDYVEDRKSG